MVSGLRVDNVWGTLGPRGLCEMKRKDACVFLTRGERGDDCEIDISLAGGKHFVARLRRARVVLGYDSYEHREPKSVHVFPSH